MMKTKCPGCNGHGFVSYGNADFCTCQKCGGLGRDMPPNCYLLRQLALWAQCDARLRWLIHNRAFAQNTFKQAVFAGVGFEQMRAEIERQQKAFPSRVFWEPQIYQRDGNCHIMEKYVDDFSVSRFSFGDCISPDGFLRYDVIPEATSKENFGRYCEIQEELREAGFELFDFSIEHDCISGKVRRKK